MASVPSKKVVGEGAAKPTRRLDLATGMNEYGYDLPLNLRVKSAVTSVDEQL